MYPFLISPFYSRILQLDSQCNDSMRNEQKPDSAFLAALSGFCTKSASFLYFSFEWAECAILPSHASLFQMFLPWMAAMFRAIRDVPQVIPICFPFLDGRLLIPS